MVTDPIGDFIIQLKNAAMVRKPAVVVPYSKLKFAVADVLRRQGYLIAITKHGKKAHKSMTAELSYGKEGNPRLQGVKRVSKPGRRLYTSVINVRPVKSGKGSLVLSTPKGILTDREARKEKVGGEMLFQVW